jgi:hypothetical protein
MAQSKFFDLIKCFSTTVGTGNLTIGPAVPGFLNFSTGGVVSGDPVPYTLFDGPSPSTGQITASETGQGTATLSGSTWALTRHIRKSTNDNAAINCSGNEVVALTLAAEDLEFVGRISGTFGADGSMVDQLPAGAVITGGRITANNSTGVTISLGSSSGGGDLLQATAIAGAPNPGQPLQGINFLTTMFASDQTIFVHAPAWAGASVTITIWFLGP